MKNEENIDLIVRAKCAVTSLSKHEKDPLSVNLTFIKGKKHNNKFLSLINHYCF